MCQTITENREQNSVNSCSLQENKSGFCCCFQTSVNLKNGSRSHKLKLNAPPSWKGKQSHVILQTHKTYYASWQDPSIWNKDGC